MLYGGADRLYLQANMLAWQRGAHVMDLLGVDAEGGCYNMNKGPSSTRLAHPVRGEGYITIAKMVR